MRFGQLLIIVVFVMASLVTATSAPVLHQFVTVRLANGSRMQMQPVGDELDHYLLSADGMRYMVGADGTALQQTALRRLAARHRNAKAAPAAATATGNIHVLVVLVNFADTRFAEGHDAAFYNRMFNEQGYTDSRGAIGSVSDYFAQQSRGALTPTYDIVGPVQLSSNHDHYGSDITTTDDNVTDMVIEACTALGGTVDFSRYDNDGDGTADQIYFLYAGRGEATVPTMPDLIWPHRWSLTEAGVEPIAIGGTLIDGYACSNEMNPDGTTPMGIGTPCHELAHLLGLEDTYSRDGSTFTTGTFDLMGDGMYNGNGTVPASVTAWDRSRLGWQTLATLEGPEATIDRLLPATSGGEAFAVYNGDDTWVVENRQKTSWDTYIATRGLTVMHIGGDGKPAYVRSSDSRYTFPGGTTFSLTVDSLTDNSRYPWKEGLRLGAALRDIVQNNDADRTVSFRFTAPAVVTAVDGIAAPARTGSDAVFTISGQFAGSGMPDAPGIYIVRGKKILIKQ